MSFDRKCIITSYVLIIFVIQKMMYFYTRLMLDQIISSTIIGDTNFIISTAARILDNTPHAETIKFHSIQ